MSEFSNVNASWKINVLCVGVCQTKLPSLAFKAVTSPILFIKNTTSPFVTRDNFFWDLINGLSVSKFQSSFPSFTEKARITLSKSTATTLFLIIFAFELNPTLLSIVQFNSPVSNFIE